MSPSAKNISVVTTGRSRSKNGVASLAYDPVVHAEMPRRRPCGVSKPARRMDCRVKPGNDEKTNPFSRRALRPRFANHDNEKQLPPNKREAERRKAQVHWSRATHPNVAA